MSGLVTTMLWGAQDMVDPNLYLQEFPAAFAAVASQFDLGQVQALYNEVDFIGISNYASLTPNFPLKDLESATFQFAEEIKYFGVDIVGLLAGVCSRSLSIWPTH
jgi:hypothetical protein